MCGGSSRRNAKGGRRKRIKIKSRIRIRKKIKRQSKIRIRTGQPGDLWSCSYS